MSAPGVVSDRGGAPVTSYTVDQAVEVHSFGRWYRGVVTKVGRTRVKVLYRTGSGAERDKAFSTELVRALPESMVRQRARGL